MKISNEILSHFRCGKCDKWWSIGDAPCQENWFCPWCGEKNKTLSPKAISDAAKKVLEAAESDKDIAFSNYETCLVKKENIPKGFWEWMAGCKPNGYNLYEFNGQITPLVFCVDISKNSVVLHKGLLEHIAKGGFLVW